MSIVIDSQVHVWEAHRPDRPWLDEFIGQGIGSVHRDAPVSASEMIAIMDASGVDRAIIVPPSAVGDNNLTAIEAAIRYPTRLAVMGRFNPQVAGAPERLKTWLEQPGMLGIRLTFHKERWSEWLEDESLAWFWDACERLRIPVTAYMPKLLHKVPGIVEYRPGLTLILDHMARQSELRDDECFADLDELLALGRFQNLAIKVTAAPYHSTHPYPFKNLTPYLRRIHQAFGPQRLMWGSDFTKLRCTYQECLDHIRFGLDFLGEDDKRWILGETARTLLQWPAPGLHR